MDDLTNLHLRNFGRQPVVKSAPMSATKAVRSSAPAPSWNRSSSERIAGDSLFGSNDDIFGGFPMSSNPSYGRSVSSSTFDSLFFDGFKEPSREFHGDDIFATMSSPPELKPSTKYDDLFTTIPTIPPPPRSNYADGDLLGNFGQKLPSKQKGLDDKKPVKVKDQGLYGFDDVFLTTTLPPNNGYDDFLDNLGRSVPEKDLSGSDELIPGFGGSIHTAPVKTGQPVPRNAMADSWENQQGADDPWFSVVAKVPKSTRTPTPSRPPPLVAFATDPFSSATTGGRGRAAAAADAEERTRQRVADALEKKMERDMEAQREQEERRGMARELDFVVKRWAAGKEGNLRALLSTLDDVLWPGCGWEPASLTDLITSTSVKKVYRKAALCVHPDKVQQKGATLQQKCIAEKVFDVLKEAWNKFNSEELQRSL